MRTIKKILAIITSFVVLTNLNANGLVLSKKSIKKGELENVNIVDSDKETPKPDTKISVSKMVWKSIKITSYLILFVCVSTFFYGAVKTTFRAIKSGELSDENIMHEVERKINAKESKIAQEEATKIVGLFDFFPEEFKNDVKNRVDECLRRKYGVSLPQNN